MTGRNVVRVAADGSVTEGDEDLAAQVRLAAVESSVAGRVDFLRKCAIYNELLIRLQDTPRIDAERECPDDQEIVRAAARWWDNRSKYVRADPERRGPAIRKPNSRNPRQFDTVEGGRHSTSGG